MGRKETKHNQYLQCNASFDYIYLDISLPKQINKIIFIFKQLTLIQLTN